MKICREILTWLVLMGQAVYVGLVWHTVPAVLPSHFGLDGLPNRHAPRSFLWVVVGISVGMAIFLSIVQRFPGTFNLPKPPGDPDRPRLEGMARELVLWLRLELVCIFAYLIWSVVQVGMERSSGLGSAFLFLSLGTVTLTVACYLWRFYSPSKS